MKLYYTPRSHYSRKVRILMGGLGLDAELIDVGDVSSHVPDQFGLNPLMKVPTLHHGDTVLFESDHIAQYLVRTFDPEDRFKVLTTDTETLNARAVMNGIMAAEVEFILSKRTGMDVEAYLRFQKLNAVIRDGVQWLEDHASLFTGEPSYADFHLVSMTKHLRYYDLIPFEFPTLTKRVNTIARIDYVAATKLPSP